jgi:chromatin assembly factor 1 subunit A
VEELMKRIQGSSSQNPIDLTSDCKKQEEALELLNATPMRYIHFEEDVRPPYWGTWTKPLTPEQCRQVARNPFTQLDLFNYDYDSEAEWEEPGEGEDLNSDDDEEEDDGEDDLDEFLDDGDANGALYPKGLGLSKDQTADSSGLQWEDEHGVLQPAGDAQKVDFSDLRMEILLGTLNYSDTKQYVLTAYAQKQLLLIPTQQSTGPSRNWHPKQKPLPIRMGYHPLIDRHWLIRQSK